MGCISATESADFAANATILAVAFEFGWEQAATWTIFDDTDE